MRVTAVAADAQLAQRIPRKKLKSRRGRRPHLRALIGAVNLIGTRKMTYREAEDRIRHYGPARFLCGLTDSTWSPDHTTIQDFTELMGEDGMRALNEYVLESAHREGLLDLKLVVGDTTAQEARMSYPTEIGLMAGFLGMVSTAARRAGSTLKACARELAEKFEQSSRLVRKYRFFDKSKDERGKTGKASARAVYRPRCALGAVGGLRRDARRGLGESRGP